MRSALVDNIDMLHMMYDSVEVMQGGYIKVEDQNQVKILDENCGVILSCDKSDFMEFREGYALVRKGDAVELKWGDASKILDIEHWDTVRNLRILDRNILFECRIHWRDWIYITDRQGNIVRRLKGVRLQQEVVHDIRELRKDIYLVTMIDREYKVFNLRDKKLIGYTYEELSKDLNTTNEFNFILKLARH